MNSAGDATAHRQVYFGIMARRYPTDAPCHKELSGRLRRHSGAIVNAKARSGFTFAIEPGIAK